MRGLYLVCYDICSNTRWRKVYKLMRGYGDHLQYSVFRCALNDREKAEFVEKLSKVIAPQDDQVLFVPLGPVGGRDEQSIVALGLPYRHPRTVALIV